MSLPTPEVIERARKANKVPPDWRYAMCTNECGELVFYPPDAEAAAAAAGVPMRIVCSARCAKQVTDLINHGEIT